MPMAGALPSSTVAMLTCFVNPRLQPARHGSSAYNRTPFAAALSWRTSGMRRRAPSPSPTLSPSCASCGGRFTSTRTMGILEVFRARKLVERRAFEQSARPIPNTHFASSSMRSPRKSNRTPRTPTIRCSRHFPLTHARCGDEDLPTSSMHRRVASSFTQTGVHNGRASSSLPDFGCWSARVADCIPTTPGELGSRSQGAPSMSCCLPAFRSRAKLGDRSSEVACLPFRAARSLHGGCRRWDCRAAAINQPLNRSAQHLEGKSGHLGDDRSLVRACQILNLPWLLSCLCPVAWRALPPCSRGLICSRRRPWRRHAPDKCGASRRAACRHTAAPCRRHSSSQQDPTGQTRCQSSQQ